MQNKLISIIIPIYNREKYIHKCIESVLNQENVETEIILVDDGSSDSSLEICNQYARNYNNIVVLHHDNHGVSYSRNRALDCCKGDYIYFLDSDDSIAPGALYKMMTALEETTAGYCVGPISVYSDDGKLASINVLPESYQNKEADIKTFLGLLRVVHQNIVVTVTGKLFRKNIWKDLRFPELKSSEDDYLLTTILSRANTVYILKDVVYEQTLSSCSIIRSNPSENLLLGSQTRLDSLPYLIENGYYDAALYRFGDGTRRLIWANRQLKNKAGKSENKKQYKGFCKASKALAKHVSPKEQIRLMLFRTNLSLYGFIQDKAAK
ncbi:glycosyltransferase family 2 protein [Butyrivibrio sp. AE3009]|uniref:glycosyltransferase family 2 protein n=1 Tax=Butyrivibrio sp. AE3009 TaxID=1280666 RepID=UPI0003B74663|nr:glycosyltransferase family 2 protein [Butyrivibrio sp. AE3009]